MAGVAPPTPPDSTLPDRPASDRVAAWVYSGLFSVLVSWFKVPDRPPALPVGPGEHHERFRPAPGFLGYLKLWFWIVAILFDLTVLVAWIVITAANWKVGMALAPLALVIGVLPDIIGYIAVHLRYDMTWYVLTDRSLRIRRGVWIIHETTLTFDNIQNVKVSQGPIERAFGIADVVVETAGAGAGSGSGTSVANRGVLEGLADAERIRGLILARLRQSDTTGLGDEPEATDGAGWTPAHLEMLREIRDALSVLDR